MDRLCIDKAKRPKDKAVVSGKDIRNQNFMEILWVDSVGMFLDSSYIGNFQKYVVVYMVSINKNSNGGICFVQALGKFCRLFYYVVTFHICDYCTVMALIWGIFLNDHAVITDSDAVNFISVFIRKQYNGDPLFSFE